MPVKELKQKKSTVKGTADVVKKQKQLGIDNVSKLKNSTTSIDRNVPKIGDKEKEIVAAHVDQEIKHESRPESSGNKSQIVNLRVPVQIVDDIDYWVGNGRYRSRSEFVLAAIRYYLDYIEYRESYNTRTFQRGQTEETPAERIERLRYLRGNP